ncbi:Pyrrolidone-carboxylate peptidase [compost metagenome]
MYGLLHKISERTNVKGGFIHIPYLPEQAAAHAGAPSMATQTVKAALEIALTVALRQSSDINAVGGATH